jgi:hypothetical protein
MPESGARAIVSDDGHATRLTLYTESGEAMSVVLAPVRAVALAGELIEAAVSKLNVGENSAFTSETKQAKRRRGGDRKAEQRRIRDDKIRALAPIVAPGKPVEQQARDITGRLARYRPMPNETSPERRLMQELVETGLPVGADRIRKILGKQ